MSLLESVLRWRSWLMACNDSRLELSFCGAVMEEALPEDLPPIRPELVKPSLADLQPFAPSRTWETDWRRNEPPLCGACGERMTATWVKQELAGLDPELDYHQMVPGAPYCSHCRHRDGQLAATKAKAKSQTSRITANTAWRGRLLRVVVLGLMLAMVTAAFLGLRARRLEFEKQQPTVETREGPLSIPAVGDH